jgi:beta-N-acetylhexosaminidase
VRHARLTLCLLFGLVVVLAAACGGPQLTTSTVGVTSTAGGSSTAGVTSTAGAAPSTSALSPTPAPAAEVLDALGAMTVRQEAAQVLLVAFDGTSVTDFTKGVFARAAPGGVLLLNRNVTDEQQLRALTAALQKTSSDAGSPGLFVAADEEGGPVMRVKDGVPELPAARVVGSTSWPARARELANATAQGLLDQGVNMVLAPVADVVDDEGSFLFERSYGSDPQLVSSFVAAVIAGYRADGVITVVKHFPGHGSAPDNSHTSAPVATAGLARFGEVHLPPFRAAIAAGTDGVMVGHFVAPVYDRAHPASQSPAIIEDLLRKDLGFKGLVVSDDLEMSAAVGKNGNVGTAGPAELGRAAVQALASGCDLLITTGTFDRQSAIEQAIVDAVSSGALRQERLDEAVTRILTVKMAHALPLAAPPAE